MLDNVLVVVVLALQWSLGAYSRTTPHSCPICIPHCFCPRLRCSFQASLFLFCFYCFNMSIIYKIRYDLEIFDII